MTERRFLEIYEILKKNYISPFEVLEFSQKVVKNIETPEAKILEEIIFGGKKPSG